MPYAIDAIVRGLLQALAIGFLIGAERESRTVELPRAAAPGLRDFILIALTGSVAGFLGATLFTALAFAAIVAVILVRRLKDPSEHGITTEIAALLTFWLGLLTQRPPFG